MNVEPNTNCGHQRTEDEDREGGHGSNGSRSSTCCPASTLPNSGSHSSDVLNSESRGADKHHRASMKDDLLPPPDAPPASDFSKLFTVARRPVIVADLFALFNYPQPN